MTTTVYLPTRNADWRINLVDPDSPGLQTSNGQNWGTTQYVTKDIYINNELHESDIDEVLIHELTHALLSETQIKDAHKYSEEDVCELMGMYARVVVDLADKARAGWGLPAFKTGEQNV